MLEVRPFSFHDRRFCELCDRETLPGPEAERAAAAAIAAVRNDGAAALERDAGSLPLRVGEDELAEARGTVSEHFLTALSLARVNLRKFHEYQRRHGYVHDDGDGVRISRRVRPVGRAGILCSSFTALLMHAVPAQVAGVGEIAAAAAPGPDGRIDPRLLAAARVLGIEKVYRMRGAYAVAAFALGTDPVFRADRIAGPGGPEAAAAKRMLAGKAGMDSGLGLSELAVIADGSASAKFIAADLIAQAEHDEGRGALVLLSSDRMLAEAVRIEMDRLTAERDNAEALREVIRRDGALYVCQDIGQAIEAVNLLAPARAALMTRHDAEYTGDIENAGMIFAGGWSAEAAGDYFAGANPYLPVGGTARFGSGLGTDDFMRQTTIMEYTPERLVRTGRHLAALALEDSAGAHAAALRERLSLLSLTVD